MVQNTAFRYDSSSLLMLNLI